MIRTEKLRKDFNGFSAVKNVTLRVQPNEIYGFLGPNGSGKTTTILMLLGIEKPTSGRIFLFDQTLQQNYFEIKRRMGVVAEHQHFYDDASARDYLRFFADLYRVENKAQRIESLLEMAGLREFGNVRAQDYSRGMQQKLGLIRAVLHDPQLLILDEPVSSLDPRAVVDMRRLLLELARQGKTIFISSHILSEVEQTADRVGIMNKGQLIAEGTLETLRRRLRPQQRLDIELHEARLGLVEQLLTLDFVRGAVGAGSKLSLTVESDNDYRLQISKTISDYGGVIVDMRSQEMSLEEAFVTITDQNVSLLAEECDNP